MAEEASKKFGRIDILVNNAAYYYGVQRKSFTEIAVEEWDKMMAVNVRGPWLCAKAVFPAMKEQGKGKIINLTSEVFFTGSHGFVHYVASKGGVIGLTRALAVELGPYSICVNAVAPGYTDTEASRTIADVDKYDTSKTPLRRLERPDDLVGAVAFLSSDESDFVTGQTILSRRRKSHALRRITIHAGTGALLSFRDSPRAACRATWQDPVHLNSGSLPNVHLFLTSGPACSPIYLGLVSGTRFKTLSNHSARKRSRK